MYHISPTTLLNGIAVLGLFASSCMLAATQKADSKRITDLFSEIKVHASLAQDDAQTLESYTRSRSIGWQSHGRRLEQVKEHGNDLLNDYNEMALLRDEGSPWQQEAIDQLRPVLNGMADHLNATIQHQREHPSHVRFEPWLEYVRGNREYVTKASVLIHDLVDYGASKSTAEALEMRLNLQADSK